MIYLLVALDPNLNYRIIGAAFDPKVLGEAAQRIVREQRALGWESNSQNTTWLARDGSRMDIIEQRIFDSKQYPNLEHACQLHQRIEFLYVVTGWLAKFYAADGDQFVCEEHGRSIGEAMDNLENNIVKFKKGVDY